MKKIITILLFSNVCFSMQMDDFKTFFNSISGVWCGKWYPYKISTESYTYKYKPGYSYLLKTNKYYASNIFFAYNTFGIYTGKSLLSPDGDILLNWNDWDFYGSISYLYEICSYEYAGVYDKNFNRIFYFTTGTFGDSWDCAWVSTDISRDSICYEDLCRDKYARSEMKFGQDNIEYININEAHELYSISYLPLQPDFKISKYKDDKDINFFYNLKRVNEIGPYSIYKEKIINLYKEEMKHLIKKREFYNANIGEELNIEKAEKAIDKVSVIYDFLSNIKGAWEYIAYDLDGKEIYRTKMDALARDGITTSFIFPVEANLKHFKAFPPSISNAKEKIGVLYEECDKYSVYPIQKLSVTGSCYSFYFSDYQIILMRTANIFYKVKPKAGEVRDRLTDVGFFHRKFNSYLTNVLDIRERNELIWYLYADKVKKVIGKEPYLKWKLSKNWDKISEYQNINDEWKLTCEFIKVHNDN